MSGVVSEDVALEALLHDVYEAALDPALLPGLMPKVCQWLGCDSSHLVAVDDNTQAMNFSILPVEFKFMERLYSEHYGKVDVRRSAILVQGHEGQMFACNQHFDERTASRSEFYQDFLVRHMDARYGAGGILATAADHHVFIVMNRSTARGGFEDEDMRRLRRLSPHLQRMVKLMRRFDGMQSAAVGGTHMLSALSQGLAMLSREGRIDYANEFAEQLMRGGQACRAQNGQLLERVGASYRIRDLCMAVWRTGVPASFTEQALRSDGEVQSYCFTITPLVSTDASRIWPMGDLMMLVTPTRQEAAPTAEQLSGWFGLTPAEARLARALAEGRTVEAYAGEAGIKGTTARTHVRAVLEKTRAPNLQGLQAMLGRLPSL